MCGCDGDLKNQRDLPLCRFDSDLGALIELLPAFKPVLLSRERQACVNCIAENGILKTVYSKFVLLESIVLFILYCGS